ncbi:MAG: YARHG domain-containing protein [Spirochaetes bacterium]|nr:YARHG domain-containing protein [Spirochaetota bacterium]
MKKFFSLIFTALIFTLNAEPVPNDWYGAQLEAQNDIAKRVLNGEITYLKYRLDYLSLAVLSKNQLQLLKRFIPAKYGFIFSEKKYYNYFRKFSWYIPDSCYSESKLTETDRLNLATIDKFINMSWSSENGLAPASLSGVWMRTPPGVAPTGYDRRFYFFQDGRFVFKYSQGRWFDAIDSFKGTFEIKGTCLKLLLKEKKINIIPEQDVSYEYEKGIRIISSSEKMNLPLFFLDVCRYTNGGETELECPCIEIGGETFYKWSSDAVLADDD